MIRVPIAPLILGLAGLIPFLWGAATYFPGALQDWGLRQLGPRYVSQFVQIGYGVVILSFMSGVLWGFATRADGARAAVCYALSVLPALWAFFFTGHGSTTDAINLVTGFLGLLLLDFAFSRWGLTPSWWMTLRVILTVVVVASLSVEVVS